MFFDRRCPVCGQPHRTICAHCVDLLRLAPELDVPWLDRLVPLFFYDDAAARLVLAAKNGGRRDLLRWAGGHLGAAIAGPGGSARSIDMVSWVPAHPEQRRSRGYDQGQLIARAVGNRLGVRVRPLLVRRSGASRKGLGRTDRLAGPEVQIRGRARGNVLLVDDVMATGASLERCADVLRSAGADRVSAGVVAASTPKSGGLPAQLGSTIYIGSPSGRGPEAT